MENKRPLLVCKNISKYFGALAAVKNLNLEVYPGEILGISGPNGAGKTTLFEVISGMDHADKGQIIFNEEEITSKAPHKICKVGLSRVFQSNACFNSLTVSEMFP